MALNKGVLTANKKTDGDEKYTPYYAVEPLINYILLTVSKYLVQ